MTDRVDIATDTTSVQVWGRHDNALGFPRTGLAFTAAADLAARVVARYAWIVTHIDTVNADTMVDWGWMPVLAELDTGRQLNVHRTHPAPFDLSCIVVGVEHRITPGRIETAIHTTTTTPTT